MIFNQLRIPGAFEVTTKSFGDERGAFWEWFKLSEFENATGQSFTPKQANSSVSSKGVTRGIHFAEIPPSQAKYVTCMEGAIIDYIVDIRVGSPTFGQWHSVQLDSQSRNAIFISAGLGHAFVTISDTATVNYLVSEEFNPQREHGIHPFDKDIDLKFPFPTQELLLSPKDAVAPSLEDLISSELLPTWDEALSFYKTQKAEG